MAMHKIESPSNPYVKHICKLIVDRAYREEHQKCVIIGKTLLEELHLEHAPIEVSEAVAKKIGSPFFAEVPLPKQGLPKVCTRLLALDAVSDPGNLGTLLRTALALGWDGVFFLPGCCDPFNDKALRAAKGALFKLPYQKGSWEELDLIAKKQDLHFFAADLTGDKPKFENHCILILGNEGQGLSADAKMRGKKISIPMKKEMESLNVANAGAILLYILGDHG